MNVLINAHYKRTCFQLCFICIITAVIITHLFTLTISDDVYESDMFTGRMEKDPTPTNRSHIGHRYFIRVTQYILPSPIKIVIDMSLKVLIRSLCFIV